MDVRNLSDDIRLKAEQMQADEKTAAPEIKPVEIKGKRPELNPDTHKEAFSEIRKNYEHLLELLNQTYQVDAELQSAADMNTALEKLNTGIRGSAAPGSIKALFRRFIKKIIYFGISDELTDHAEHISYATQCINHLTAQLRGLAARQSAFNALIARYGLSFVPMIDEKIRYAASTMDQILIENVKILTESINTQSKLLADRMDILHEGLDRRQTDVLTWLKNTQRDVNNVLKSFKQLEKETLRSLSLQYKAIRDIPKRAVQAPAAVHSQPEDSLDDYAYYLFEMQNRGSEEHIRHAQADYIPLFKNHAPVLDIGCGRGEFLLLLKEAGIEARGIDLNSAMVHLCREKNLDAAEHDAIDFLKNTDENAWGAVFAAQVIEHFPRKILAEWFKLVFRCLKPGGLFCFETVNTASPYALFNHYFRDPSHQLPIHPETYRFLMETNGFRDVSITYRSPVQEISPDFESDPKDESIQELQAEITRLKQFIYSPCDISVTGYKVDGEQP